MDYGRILSRSLQIAWRYKGLWLFGFLLSLFGSCQGGNLLRYSYGYPPEPTESSFLFLPQGLVIGLTLALLAFGCLWIIVGLVTTFLSRVALISMVNDVAQVGTTTIPDGFRHGLSVRTLRVFLISLIIGIPLTILIIVLILFSLSPLLLLLVDNTVVRTLAVMGTVVLLLFSIGLAILMGAVASLLREFIDRQCVIADKGVLDSIGAGLRMVWQNLGSVAVLWLLIFGIGLGWGLITMVLLLGLGAVISVVSLVAHLALRTTPGAIGLVIILGLVTVVLMAFINGLMEVFRSTVWTLTYLEVGSSPSSDLP
ncbi:MAG: hypothetical protein ACE5NP_07310 [Anaerolineae bacterium]